jgi:heptosyltransferase-2
VEDAAAGELVTDRGGRLVVAPNWIGDAVMSLPVLRALARSCREEPLTVLARPGPAAIYRAEGSAREVRTITGLVGDALATARAEFAEAWILPNSFRSAVVPYLAAIRERIGYATDGRSPLLTLPVPPPSRDRHQLRDYDPLLRSRGIDPDTGPPRLPIPPESQALARETIARAGLSSGLERLILLAPGAAFSWTKRWPGERFGALAAELLARELAIAIVIGPGEEELARTVSAVAEVPLPVLGANLDPVGLAALASLARLVVANDSGPMHLAAAVGTPVVALFGPTDPGRTGPVGSPSIVLDRYVFCSPCYLKECPYAHECLRGIEVREVVSAVERLLAVRS